MSNIYIQEPPTSGKVLLKTTVGDIDIELWARETPKACRNFIQLCMEGYYNGTIFHRLVKGFIVQGGDPNGNGSGGESIYSEPFKDEFHSRLRFTRRGLLAMANSGPNDNGSQFFFTLGATPELQNKHTLFGKITGDTIYNMLKLEDGLVDENERPLYPHKIIKTEILNNPFDDIEPRIIEKEVKTEKKEKRHEKGVKNFGLLSFGAEAEEDEAETTQFVKKIAGKSKSTHDVLDDPKLSKEVYKVDKKLGKRSPTPEIEEFNKKELNENEIKETTEKIRSKLKGNVEKQQKQIEKKDETSSDDSDDDYLNDVQKEKNKNRKRQAEKIREEILEVKKQYKEDKKRKFELMDSDRIVEEEKKQRSELMEEYLSEKDKYTHLKKDLPKKGAPREQFTLQLLAKFKSKLDSIKDKTDDSDAGQSSKEIVHDSKAVNDDNDDDIEGDNWLSHELHFVEKLPVLAKDAATKEDDWYDVYDPRNPLNKRRRGADQRKTGRNESDQKYSRRRDDMRQK